MKKKNYLSAFAAAALLASCSSEMEEFAGATGSQDGIKVNITVNKAGDDTRLVLGDDGKGAAWEKTDMFSMFKLTAATPGKNLTGDYNAAYSTTDGSNFTSTSVLYGGNHALVFPLDKNYTSSSSDITVEPSTDGGQTLGNRMVYLSKTPIEISAAGIEIEKVKYNQSGYQKDIKVTVYPASSSYVFTLNMANELQLGANDPKVTINKVELVASKGTPFATKANLQTKSVTVGKGSETRIVEVPVAESKTSSASVEFATPIPFEKGTKVRLVTMAADEVADATTFDILVHTNYGVAKVSKAAAVTNDKGNIQTAEGPVAINDKNKDAALSFKAEANAQRTNANSGDAVPTVNRNVTVDMSTCDINGMKITNSPQLLAAYRAYDILKKDNAALTLSAATFELTEDAVKEINSHKYDNKKDKGVKLNTDGVTTITLSGFGAEYATVPAIDQITSKALILGKDSKWTIDVKNAKEANAFSSITNYGTLKLTESAATAKDNAVLGNGITNEGGTLEFGDNVTVPTALTQSARIEGKTTINPTLNIGNAQTVFLSQNSTLAGTVNVGDAANSTAILATTGSSTVTLSGTTNVWGSLLNKTGCKINNGGTINIKDNNAGVIITSNNVINVLSKNNNVRVSDSVKGYIKLPVTTEAFTVNADNMGVANYVVFSGSTLTLEADVFNVECNSNASVQGNNATERTIPYMQVNGGKQVTIPTGSTITPTNLKNDGIIRVFGTFKTSSVTGTGTIYRFN